MALTEERTEAERVETATMALKAPVEWFERLDAWRLAHPQKPSRPASIRWIVWQFLAAEEVGARAIAKAAKAKARKGARSRRSPGRRSTKA